MVSMKKLTPQVEYNLMVADMFDAIPIEYLESHIGQTIIRYFCERIQKRFADPELGT